MINPDQKEMLDVLDQRQKHQQKLDRVFKIVIPIMAFLLCVICANMNWQSTLGTFIMLWVAFYAVGIKRLNVWLWVFVVALYGLVDIFFSYGTFQIEAIGRQMGTMMVFVIILGIGRPYVDQWFIK
ncbi:hypothetical protein [Acinetobacter gerneri]|uniref:hypothetical protein n=1 Tax=Acinetobacter gerneri TaxID=202952 RepID=UPI003A89E987